MGKLAEAEDLIEWDLEFYTSMSYFFETTSEMKIELPLIKLCLKSQENQGLCSVSVSTLSLDSISIPTKRKESMRLTVDKVTIKDLVVQESIGSIADIKFTAGKDKAEDSCKCRSLSRNRLRTHSPEDRGKHADSARQDFSKVFCRDGGRQALNIEI